MTLVLPSRLSIFLPTVLCCLMALPVTAQQRSVNLELSPHFGSARLVAGSDLPFEELERTAVLESGRFGYGAGLIYESAAERIGFSTGLRYLRTGYQTAAQAIVPGQENRAFELQTDADYLSLPFEVNFYQDLPGRSRILFSIGTSANLHLGTTTQRTEFDGGIQTATFEIEDQNTYRPVVFALTTAIGYDYRLNDNWALRLQPHFHFFLGSSISDETFARLNRNYYQLGGRLTVRRIF